MYPVHLSLSVPNKVKEDLQREAKRRELSVSKLATEILKDGLVIFKDQDLRIPRKYA